MEPEETGRDRDESAGGSARLEFHGGVFGDAILGPILGSGSFPVAKDLSVPVAEYARPQALVMLLAPALTISLCIRGRSLIHAIWYGILSGIAIGLFSGSLTIADLYYLRAPGEVGGAITEGLVSMGDVVFLAIFVMAVRGPLRAAGALEALVVKVRRFASTEKRAELAIFGLVTLRCPLTAGNTPAMLFCGPVVKDIGKKFQIHRTRRANLMDLAGNGVTENLPHMAAMLALAGAMMVSSETTGAPLVPILLVGALAVHSMMLTAVGLFSIATGWGSRKG